MKYDDVKIPKFCLTVLRWIPNNINHTRKLVKKNDMEKPHTLILEKGGRMCCPIICKESFKYLPAGKRKYRY